MRPFTLTRNLLALVLLAGVSISARGQVEEEPQVAATFDGGRITRLDVDAWAAKDYSRILRGTPEEARIRVERQAGGREELLKNLASVRILAETALKHGLPLGVTRESQLQVEREKILAALYFSRLVEPEVEEARQAHQQRCLAYYNDHAEEYIKSPRQWTFRFIHVGKPVGSGQEVTPEEKERFRGRALEVYELCRSGEDFVSLARGYSVNAKERRGILVGPTSLERQPKAIASALQTLATGEVSTPVETDLGFFILRCEGVTAERRQSFAEARPRIEKQLGRFSPDPIIREFQSDLHKKYPFETRIEALSDAPEAAEDRVVEGTAASISNRDIYRPDLLRYIRDEHLGPEDILHMARIMYWRRLCDRLARNAGLHEEPLISRALQWSGTMSLSNVLRDNLKQGVVMDGLPAYEPSWPAYREKLLQQHHFQRVEE